MEVYASYDKIHQAEETPPPPTKPHLLSQSFFKTDEQSEKTVLLHTRKLAYNAC